MNQKVDYSRAYHQRIGGRTIEKGTRKMVGNRSNGYGCIRWIQDLMGKKTRQRDSQRRKWNSHKASRIAGAGSLFQGSQHLIGELALSSQRREGTSSKIHEAFLLVSKALQWRVQWFRRQTKGIRMDSGG
jgi:hypothetical protein